jgi:hypothetical protein
MNSLSLEQLDALFGDSRVRSCELIPGVNVRIGLWDPRVERCTDTAESARPYAVLLGGYNAAAGRTVIVEAIAYTDHQTLVDRQDRTAWDMPKMVMRAATSYTRDTRCSNGVEVTARGPSAGEEDRRDRLCGDFRPHVVDASERTLDLAFRIVR